MTHRSTHDREGHEVHEPRRAVLAAGPLLGLMLIVAACGGSAAASPSGDATASRPATGAAGGAASQPATTEPTDPESSDDGSGGGDGGGSGTSAGDRSKGSARLEVSGGLTRTIDLAFVPALAIFGINGENTAYLPFTEGKEVLFITLGGEQTLVQYAEEAGVGIANGPTPCAISVETISSTSAKGTFDCKGMTLIQGESLGSADVKGSFEGNR